MSKAEEYYRKINEIWDRNLTISEKEKIKELESYLQHRVNKITDERLKVLQKFPFKNPNTQHERICELKLIKNKILKG